MTSTDHGPGVTWLAHRENVEPEALLSDGTALMSALESAGRDALDLAKRLMSDDPETLKRAEAEARVLRARLSTPPGGKTPEERFRERVAAALALRETNAPRT